MGGVVRSVMETIFGSIIDSEVPELPDPEPAPAPPALSDPDTPTLGVGGLEYLPGSDFPPQLGPADYYPEGYQPPEEESEYGANALTWSEPEFRPLTGQARKAARRQKTNLTGGRGLVGAASLFKPELKTILND